LSRRGLRRAGASRVAATTPGAEELRGAGPPPCVPRGRLVKLLALGDDPRRLPHGQPGVVIPIPLVGGQVFSAAQGAARVCGQVTDASHLSGEK